MSNKAFTLIELLVVIAIIGILAGFIIVSMGGAQGAASDARRKADINQLSKAVMIYKTNNPDTPLLIDADGCNIGSDCSPDEIFGSASVLRDPNGTYYSYTSADGVDFTITSTLSNDHKYLFDSSTGTYTEGVGINGVCGTANKAYYITSSSFGTDTFCTGGTLSSTPSFPSVGTPSTWSCIGSGGGIIASCNASKSSSSCISGGGLTCSETVDGNYVVNKYVLSGVTTGTTTWTVPSGVSSVEYLVVGGGGGGGGHMGGGGGAGGFLATTGFPVSGSITVSVGAGGIAGDYPTTYKGGDGTQSSFGSIIANGGGGGGGFTNPTSAPQNEYSYGNNGGSGGGGGAIYDTGVPVVGIGNQGNNGGTGNYPDRSGGGGGGAGLAGSNSSYYTGGSGGAGLTSNILKSDNFATLYVCGGGGGGGQSNGGSASYGGGSGGKLYTIGTDGSVNTGGGGGGGRDTAGGKGGSGMVVIRYLVP
ncbi:MAG: type II secretion system protein [Candidatus Pacebacteria bacterium]|nr:type II secretion system protein [Candidatus Paceibacterota bacterium]